MRVNMRDLLSRLSVRGGSTQPHIEGCGADAGIVAWGQGLVVDLRTEVAGVNIWGHGTRVAFGLQIAPHEIVATDALRSRQFDHSVDWRHDGDFGEDRKIVGEGKSGSVLLDSWGR